MRSTPNILRVIVDGSEVSRDHDLNAEEQFEFETDRGNFYRVRKSESDRKQTWTVERIESAGDTPAGTVTHQKPWLIFGSPAHAYFKPGATASSGSQNDLWNAVQSLAE